MSNQKLTAKQEKFCIEVVKQPNQSDAYRIAYDAGGMNSDSVNVNASKLMADAKIALRVKELKNKVVDKELYTLSESITRDLSLIKRYEDALDTLSDKDAKEKELIAAGRVIRFIGAGGYSSAQDRLSKQHGFYEKDNVLRVEGEALKVPVVMNFVATKPSKDK